VVGDLLGFFSLVYFKGLRQSRRERGHSQGTGWDTPGRRLTAGRPPAGLRRSAVALVSKHLGFGIGSKHFFYRLEMPIAPRGEGSKYLA
jgi:hypothetical protein